MSMERLLVLVLAIILTVGNVLAQNDSGESADKDTIFIQLMPTFPGGEKKLYKYIKKHLVYPKQAKKEMVTGTVKVNFTIDSTGFILPETVNVVNRIHPLLDAEAIKLVKGFPNWNPAIARDRAIACQYILPVRFY